MTQVLLIDDDVELLDMLAEYLKQEGFGVKVAHDGETGAAEALSGAYSIVVLDVMMPRLNGLETLKRIRAILRRTGRAAEENDRGSTLAVNALTMWPEQRRASWDGVPLELTSTEFNLLEVLVRNAGKPVSKNELSEQGLGRPLARFDRNIDVHLSSLRHKLGSLSDGRSCIQTVYRLGYQFIRE